MALEDLALFRALPGSTVFYPSDAVSTERAVELAANTKGVCFIRSSRPATTQGILKHFFFKPDLNEFLVYKNEHSFDVGQANFIKEGSSVAVFVSLDELRVFKFDIVFRAVVSLFTTLLKLLKCLKRKELKFLSSIHLQ